MYKNIVSSLNILFHKEILNKLEILEALLLTLLPCTLYNIISHTYAKGPLLSVTKLLLKSSSTTITISWDPPFSLNLTTAEPDIQYCVDVYNVTGGGADLGCLTDTNTKLLSICHLTMTNHSYNPDSPNASDLFCFKVTPVSNVPGAIQHDSSSEQVHGHLITSTSVICRLFDSVCAIIFHSTINNTTRCFVI